ncbi:hypothetical protein GO283_04383 [Ralstonia solanacearum]|nr:hypothetical protein [Ralstonia solanacearum]
MSDISVVADATQTAASKDELEVRVYGVGHGDCLLIELKRAGLPAFRMLCDGGKASGKHIDQLVAYLAANKRSDGPDLDVVVLTHVDQDHQGGLHTLTEEAEVRIGEYWGPCLPAFRRLRWLFSQRVQNGVDRASQLERTLVRRGVRVIYPMEGYVESWASGRVSAAVISPPARLLQRLLSGRQEDVNHLANVDPMPMEWLITPSADGPEQEEQAGGLGRRTFSVPADFGDESAAPPVEPDATTGFYSDETAEPNFFGNRVLNNTSLVIALDVWLDGKRRRRVLLTGDQENWSYIASRHPAGLGVDVLKVPHHGGMVYLADKKDDDQEDRDAGVVEQAYLWLRPRIAIVSARGTYDLPHTRVRNALRASGAAILCTNVRGVEHITPPASAPSLNNNCFAAYGCDRHKQPSTTVLTVTGDSERMDRAACASDSGARGVAPIVVMTQRLVDPDEAFLRWTKTELEKHANWLSDLLADARRDFKKAVVGKGLLSAMECSPVEWHHIETHAKAEGRRHFLASPYEALHYARARGGIWISEEELRYGARKTAGFYALPTSTELEAIWRWVAACPNILLRAKTSEQAVVANDKLSILSAADTGMLCRVVAAKMHIPVALAKAEVMPRLFLRMSDSFAFQICDADLPYRRYERRPFGKERSLLLWLRGEKGAGVPVPDLFDDNWTSHLWSGRSDEAKLDFLVSEAGCSAFVGPALFLNYGYVTANWDAFSQFEAPFEGGSRKRVPGVFRQRFESAGWLQLG